MKQNKVYGVGQTIGMFIQAHAVRRMARFAIVAMLMVYGLGVTTIDAEAAVTILDTWTEVSTGQPAVGGGNAGTFTVSAGSNRVLVVAYGGELNATQDLGTSTATYGTSTMTRVVDSSPSASTRRNSVLFICDETCLAGASNTTISITPAPDALDDATDQAVHAASYQGVDQTTPYTNTLGVGYDYGGGTTANVAAADNGGVVVASGDVYIYSECSTNSGQDFAAIAGFTEQIQSDTTSFTLATGTSNAGTTGTITSSSTNSSANVAISAMALKQLSCVDSDPASLTITNPTNNDTVTGSVTIQAQVGTETDPSGSMSSMLVNIAGSTGCNVIDGNMSWNGTSSRWEYTWDTSACGTGSVDGGVTVAVSGVDDDCGTAVNSTQVTNVTIDNTDSTPPTAGAVTVSPDSGTLVPAAFTITTSFSDAESAVTSCDYTLNGSTWSAGTVSGSGPYTCTANATGQSDGATLTINMRGTSDGGTTTASAITRDVDAVAPSVSISVAGSTTGSPVAFTVTFDEAVTGFTNSDVTLGGTAGATTANVSGGPSVYTVNVTGMSGDGTITMDIGADVAFDPVNNGNTAATQASTDWTACTPGTITYDGGVPNPITTATFDFSSYVTLTNSGDSTVSNAMYSVNGATWTSVATPYTLPAKTAATINVRFMADDTCSGTVYDDNGANDGSGPGYAINIDTRVDPIEPVSQTITQSGLTGFLVKLVYCNDKNGNATFRVDYKLSSSGTWTNGTPVSDGGAGDTDGSTNEEVIISITGLIEGETYDIRMTYIDDTDGVTGTAEYIETKTLVAWVDDPLLHNALRFACDKAGYWDQTSCEGAGGTWTLDRKWATGWGTTGGEYGPIRCDTCHEKDSGNIKRVKSSILAGSGSFPGSTVVLATVEDGTSDFGDDTGGHATSNKVCEVCHSVTNYHRYDTTSQAGGTDHYNQADCIKCHEHKIGFRASCDSCHASPPLAVSGLVENVATTQPALWTGSATHGEHQKHAVDLAYECNSCHNGWQANGEMPKDGELNIGFVTPGTDGGIYNGRTGGGGYFSDANTTVNLTDAMTCASIYCHGYQTPQWNPTATADCGACHGEIGSFGDDRAGAPIGGSSLDLAGAASGFKVGKHANHLDNSIAETGDPCALCHFGTLYADNTHVDGTVNVTLRQVAQSGDGSTGGAGTSAVFNAGSPGRCSNMECHGDADWDSNASGGCTLCHGYPPVAASAHASGVNPVNHDMFSATGVKDNHNDCAFCHGYKDNGSGVLLTLTVAEITGLKGDTAVQPSLAGYHMDGKVTINGNANATGGDDAGYNSSNGGCDTAACHANDASHRFTSANGGNLQLADIGPGACSTCHDGSDPSAPVVTTASTHTKVLKTDGSGSDCTVCHSGHYAGGTGVQIPNNTKVGINYAATGHGGIMLGGTETTINATIRGLTTEAQICWACHDLAANLVSEWELNQQAATGNLSYNYGTLSTSNWTTATWDSGTSQFGYKSGNIQSIHSTTTPGAGVNDGKGQATGSDYAKSEPKETVAAIRCSYCHDVHELAYASGDTKAGKPYLRGSWQGNIYPEDGAPLSGMTNWTQVPQGSANSSYMNVPRASASTSNTGITGQTNLGAYWIDQNNPNHNLNTLDADGFAGLCELCHGDGDGSWFTTGGSANNEIDSIDQYTGENLWVSGNNGHLNVVKGASGTTATAHNIFDTSRRGSAQVEDRTGTRPNPYLDMGGKSITARGYSWRETGEGGFGYEPLMTHAEPEVWRIFQWDNTGNLATGTAALVVDGGTFTYQDGTATNQSETTQANYHTFTCAKCHNPHASRLPKLMITNCLDTKQNTWDENHTSQATNAAANEWQNSYASQWPAAQNCHRLDERAPTNTSWGQGWNTVTPW